LVFAICAFLISIPLSFYFAWGNAFLNETDRPFPTALQTLCQFSEIVVMLVMPWFISRIGLRNVLLIGMAAWAARYLCFATLSFPLVLVGLLVHGFCYCFVFIASFIFADKKAPAGTSASAQSLVAFIIWGVGMFVGTQLAGITAGLYPPATIAATVRSPDGTSSVKPSPLPNWEADGDKAEKTEKVAQLPAAFGSPEKDRIPISLVEKYPQPALVLGDTSYAKSDLVAAFKAADADGDALVTRPEWRMAQAHRWPPIWLLPAGLAALVTVLFAIGGREKGVKAAQEEAATAKV
jgi:MFS family permease